MLGEKLIFAEHVQCTTKLQETQVKKAGVF